MAVPGFLKLSRNREKDQVEWSGHRLLCRVFVGEVSGLGTAKRVHCFGQMEQNVHTEEVGREGEKRLRSYRTQGVTVTPGSQDKFFCGYCLLLCHSLVESIRD